MRLHVSWLWIGCAALFPLQAEPRFSFHVMGNDPGGWPELLSSIGLTSGSGGGPGVIVAQGADLPPAEWRERVEHGVILVLEGESPLAAPRSDSVPDRSPTFPFAAWKTCARRIFALFGKRRWSCRCSKSRPRLGCLRASAGRKRH